VRAERLEGSQASDIVGQGGRKAVAVERQRHELGEIADFRSKCPLQGHITQVQVGHLAVRALHSSPPTDVGSRPPGTFQPPIAPGLAEAAKDREQGARHIRRRCGLASWWRGRGQRRGGREEKHAHGQKHSHNARATAFAFVHAFRTG
jgi:hypothetical protein